MTQEVQHPLDFIPKVAAERAAQLRQEKASTKRRLFLVGISGSGKSYSTITTAPNPVLLEYDNQLDATEVKSALKAVWSLGNPAWLKNAGIPAGDAGLLLLKILRQDLTKLPPDYTVILDSMTSLADIVEEELWGKVPTSKVTKEKDGYAFWDMWGDFWCEVCTALAQLPCNVVVIAHEKETRDEETGRLLNYGWLLGGKKFTPRFPQFFTDVCRQTRKVEVDPASGRIKSEEYLWQIHPTKDFPYSKSRCSTQQLNIKADWKELMK